MNTKLIELEDGVLVEIEVPPDQAQQISGGLAERIGARFDNIQSVLVRIGQPIIAAWRELSKEVEIEKAEVEVGLSFEGEGNLYITRAKSGANLSVKLILQPFTVLEESEIHETKKCEVRRYRQRESDAS